MIRLTDKQITKIHQTYAVFKSIRKTAALLNLKPNQIFKTLKQPYNININNIYNNNNINNKDINNKEDININIKDIKKEVISHNNIFKTKIPTLIDKLILKLLRELKVKYIDLNPRDLAASIVQLLNSKMKIESLKLEESKANLIQEIYGNYENMLALYREIAEQQPGRIIEVKELPEPDRPVSEINRLVKLT